MLMLLVESISHLLWSMHLDNSEKQHNISLPILTTHYDKAAFSLKRVHQLDAYRTTLPGSLMQDHEQVVRSEEHTSELQSRLHLVCRLLLEKKKRSTRTPAS